MIKKKNNSRPALHIVSLPHTETTTAYDWCAFTAKTRKFSTMMSNFGYDVYLYAGEVNEASCLEHICLFDRSEQKRWFGKYDWSRDTFNEFDPKLEFWKIFNARAADEIKKRAKAGDILGLVMGPSQQEIALSLKDIGIYEVEIGVGYTHTCSPFRVFESYALRHFLAERPPNDDVKPFDVVIPNFFEPEAFPEGKGNGDYFLFIGRVIKRKGPHIAAEVCKILGKKLIVAGQGVAITKPPLVTHDGTLLDGDVEYLGVVDPIKRAELMGAAKAVFVPTLYLEPFGGVAVEAMMCGTPVITTDWGAFTETVIDGITGFRCHTQREFVEAAKTVGSLDRKAIRSYALSRYSTEVIAKKYDDYFQRIIKDYDDMQHLNRTRSMAALVGKKRLAEANPNHDIWLNLSLAYYNMFLYQECIDAATEALKFNPTSPEAFNNISVGYRGLGQWKMAIDAANTALNLRPNFELARQNLIAALKNQER